MGYVRIAWRYVSRLAGPAKSWASKNIGKIIEWVKNGATFEWISNKIDKILGN